MRSAGMKVALVAHPEFYVDDQVCFLMDHHRGGNLLMSEVLARWASKILMVKVPYQPVYVERQDEGMRKALRDLRSEIEVEEMIVECAADDQLTPESRAALRMRLRSLPDGAMVIAQFSHLAAEALDTAREAGIDVPGTIGVVSCNATNARGGRRVSGVAFPPRDILMAAADYAMDASIKADFIFQKYFPPVFEDHGTIRKTTCGASN
jgi:DNA-binding LacI/PurR family transcriptional regulator